MVKTRILVVEDEIKIARFVQLELEHEGYATELVRDGRSGLEKAQSGAFDLILLDVMLPSLNGMEVLRRLRQSSEVPVIMLTAKGDVMDRVTGLDSGADDYIVKPFAIEELLARIRKVCKQKPCSRENTGILEVGALCLDSDRHHVTYAGDTLELTKTEFDLLKYLMQNKDLVVTREQILMQVWGYDYAGDTNVVDVFIRYLRSKLDEKYNRKFIHTVRGVGYQMRNEA
ncbi:MAG: response regulator transcription factor [Clostridia bacterium]|jgi:DNA-binding response OmpR family regulator|nr:response regulator transcription factor [Clostridia bacterium]